MNWEHHNTNVLDNMNWFIIAMIPILGSIIRHSLYWNMFPRYNYLSAINTLVAALLRPIS